MVKRTLFLYITFFTQNVIVGSIPLASIVSFKCYSCKPTPDKCCVGTLIFPNIALTTAYCAKACQYVNDIPIRMVYIHQQSKNYADDNYFFVRKDIGLVIIGSETTKRKNVVKLSALDPISTIGLKAFFPVMNSKKPRLRVTYVEKCTKERDIHNGYYVCTTNQLTRDSVKSCRDLQKQGVPLLVEDRILAVTTSVSQDQCHYPQRVFVAVGPVLPWIGYTLKKLGYEDHKRDTLFQSSTSYRRTSLTATTDYPEARYVIDEELLLKSLRSGQPEMLNTYNASWQASQFTGTTAIRFIPRIRQTKLTPTLTTCPNASTNLVTMQTITVPALSVSTLSSRNESTTLVASSQTNTSSSSASTSGNVSSPVASLTSLIKLPSPTAYPLETVSPLRTASSFTLLSFLPTRIKSYPASSLSSVMNLTSPVASTPVGAARTVDDEFVNISSRTGSTSIMEWFKQKLKHSLQKGTPPVLIVGNNKPLFSRTTLFVDLT